MTERKIQAMHKRFGTCGVLLCKDCSHLISGNYHDRRYHKCELYGLSHSEATDWRLSWQACGMYDVPQNMDMWVPVMKLITHGPHGPKVEPPLDGQVRLEI